MKQIKNIFSLLLCLGLLLAVHTGQADAAEAHAPAAPLLLKVSAGEAVSSNTNALHDPVTCKTVEGTTLANGLQLPAGTMLTGQITKIKKSNGWGCPGKIEITFTEAKTADGTRFPLSAVLKKRGSAPNFFVQYSLLGGFIKGHAAQIEAGSILQLNLLP